MSQPTESTYLRSLPSVDRLLRTSEAVNLRQELGSARLTAIAREVTERLRQEIRQGLMLEDSGNKGVKQNLLDCAVGRLREKAERERLSRIRHVINATGVILHTNLGRAPLSEAARKAVTSEAAGYCTLEYDALSGRRGKRGESVEKLLKELTGAEDALVVNNCAAAALLILKVLAADTETIVSRGELVEIGGDFRVPDVMANSGTRMVEVGSTNRTRLEDYTDAITDRTRLILHVHPSNYRIIGFTGSPTLAELAECAHKSNLLLYVDAGSGVLADLSEQGIANEPVIKDCVTQGADVVSFSGDKLLGSAQSGLIVGRTAIIERLRKHSLYRALRADKLCLTALEATLDAHLRGAALAEVPALQMLAASRAEIEARARNVISQLPTGQSLLAELIPGQSAIGGGCGPDVQPETTLIALAHRLLSADSVEEYLRSFRIPIIARVASGKVLLDLRTIPAGSDEEELVAALESLAAV